MFAFRLAVGHGAAQGHIGLVLLDTLLVVALLVTAVGLELRALEERLGGRVAALRARAGVVASMALLCAATAAACAAAWAPLLEAVR